MELCFNHDNIDIQMLSISLSVSLSHSRSLSIQFKLFYWDLKKRLLALPKQTFKKAIQILFTREQENIQYKCINKKKREEEK